MRRVKFDRAKIQMEDGCWLMLRIPVEYRQPARAFAAEMPDKLHVAEIRLHREHRSLDANAYCWTLLEKLARALNRDKDSMYLEMLERYGKFIHVIVKPEAAKALERQYRLVRRLGEVLVNGKSGVQYQCYYGSSTYDTAEMARLIDGIVQECRDLDIETEPPEELARMKREWDYAPDDKSLRNTG